MRLLLVELTRFRARRAIALMIVAAALLTALIAATTAWDTRPVSEADRAAAQAQADREAQQPYVRRELARCERNPDMFLGPGGDPAECAAAILPQPEWFLFRAELALDDQNRSSGIAVIAITVSFMIIIGATFAGADWASGSMSNQLLFEPRRTRVWLAKAGAVFLGTLVATAVIVTSFWGALFLVAESRDIQTGASVQEAIRWTAGRGILLAGAAGVGGFALSMLLRHTVGTLALMFAYAVGGEILLASLPFQGMGRWSLTNNVVAWLRDGHEFYDDRIECPRGPAYCEQTSLLSLADASVFLGGLLLLAAVSSLLLFRRRDVP